MCIQVKLAMDCCAVHYGDITLTRKLRSRMITKHVKIDTRYHVCAVWYVSTSRIDVTSCV